MELANRSPAESIASLPDSKRSEILNSLNDEEILALLYDWKFWARPAQRIPPGEWFCWLLRSGRGFGKTRTGSETILQWAMEGYTPIALVGQTKADVRDTMVELGDSSILKVCPPWFYPEYEPSKRRLTFPNGTICIIYSGDEPGQLRGPQHMKAWVDELAKFKYPDDSWDNLEMGLRLGDAPQVICTTTPRPIPIIKKLVADPNTIETRGSTFDNAGNLNPRFMKRMLSKYGGTRLGRQELNGDILDDNPDALWQHKLIDKARVSTFPELDRIVVGVDPAVTSNEGSDDTGIIVAGVDRRQDPHEYYILGDYTVHESPRKWATAVVSAFNKHNADRVIGEVNNGGDLVEVNIRTVDENIPYKSVRASRGKATRAEPISSLYEQERVHHVGFFPQLEDQMCDWVPGEGKSPDRVDALVWAITELKGPEYEQQELYWGTGFGVEETGSRI